MSEGLGKGTAPRSGHEARRSIAPHLSHHRIGALRRVTVQWAGGVRRFSSGRPPVSSQGESVGLSDRVSRQPPGISRGRPADRAR